MDSAPKNVRHRKGCGCKKSLCQRKYCECFQAGVGCSETCYCENCKNSYGTREEYNEAIPRARNDVNWTDGRLGVGIAQSNSSSTQPVELNTHVPSHIPPFQSSMENVTPSSQIAASDHLMPDLVPGTRNRPSLINEFMQETSTHNAYSVSQSVENMGHLQQAGVVPFGSVQSYGRYPHRLQTDLIQAGSVQSAARDLQRMRLDLIQDGLVQSVARDPQRMQSTLNHPHDPLSDHWDEDMHASWPDIRGNRFHQ